MPISSGALGNPNSYYNKPEKLRNKMARPGPGEEPPRNKNGPSSKHNKAKNKNRGKENGGKGKRKKKKKAKKKKFAEDDDDGKVGRFRRMFTRMFSTVNETKVQDISGGANGKAANGRDAGVGLVAGAAAGGAAGGAILAGSTFSDEHTSVSMLTDCMEEDSDVGSGSGLDGEGHDGKEPMRCCCCICRCYLCCCCYRGFWWWVLLLLLLLLLAGIAALIWYLTTLFALDEYQMLVLVTAEDDGATTAPVVAAGACDGTWGESFFAYRKNESVENSTLICCYSFSARATNKSFYPEESYVVINQTDCLDKGASCLSVWGKTDPDKCLACGVLANVVYTWVMVLVAYLCWT